MFREFKQHPISFAKTLISLLLVCTIVMIALFFFLQRQETSGWYTEMTEKTLCERSQYITHRIEMYLDKPRQAGMLMADLVKAYGDIHSPDVETQLKEVLSNDFSHPDSISRLGLATAEGKYVAFERDNRSGNLFLIKTSPTVNDQLNIYRTASEHSEVVNHVANYNIFSRGWFIQAMTKDTPFWTRNYYHMSTNQGQVMSWRLPLYDNSRRFLGVIFSDINPAVMSQLLATFAPNKDSTLLLIDSGRNIIASSRPEYQVPATDVHQGQYVSLPNIDTFPALKTMLQGMNEQSRSTQLVTYHDEDYFVTVHPVRDGAGLFNGTMVMIAPNVHPFSLFKTRHSLALILMPALALLFMLLMIMLVRQFFHPLHQLVQKTQLLGKQSWKPVEKDTLFTEIAVLEKELSSASGLITVMLNEQKQRIEKDKDTGLLTREGFLHEPMLLDDRNLLLMIHVTNFHDMRSTLGQRYATKFIRFFAESLVQLAPTGSVFCRYSEDFVIVVFPGHNEQKDLDTYWGLVSSLFQDTPARHLYDEQQETFHVFTGYAGAVLETITAENLLECMMNAGLALQQIRTGSNREYVLFQPEMRENELNNIRMFQALREDLVNDGFHLVLQPIVDLDYAQTFTEGECLIRWQSAELGFVPPDVFIGLAERTGTIIKLGRWIIEEACRELAAFIARGAPDNFKLHINISAVQLQQPDFSEHLLASIQRNELINSNICLEITESVLLQNSHEVIDTLNYLRRLGLSVAIDDFGSGYSSLSYLHLLPFDCLKIDRDFVSGIIDDQKSEAIIASVIMLSQSFGVPLVAEGVESAEMGEKLQGMGCEKAQGYHYSRPQPFTAWEPNDGTITVNAK
ncbi:GGDEF domain-containing protein [Scandinavium sp. V105_16]|uniref:GGDEF domain-containing protein n=1 Tax=Scandinavium lactucae TaxID=3095028 RepID=A0AAJ2S4G8_9ENTR|nr:MULTISPECIES: GGDEF domain-containing protein [unclassified Scandinavium]MDX6020248.1 GGDEF domain-containing protein [Scandinavium sp. V105_16]MDX6032237.1 GGDEF domain-containing protein [Scandinavium sp. V105_12]